MSNVQRGTIVKVFLKFQNIECAERVIIAITSYFSSNYGDYSFAEIRDGGMNNNELTVIFIGSEQNHKEVAESVHRFLSSFIDEFYDDTLEDDWLNEMDCDEMPLIVSYEVSAARDYIAEEGY